jgi:hypothetical protein
MAIPSGTRACIAYVAAVAATGRSATAVYDYAASKYISISGDVSTSEVSVYDHERGCHFKGQGRAGSYQLYDYGRSGYVKLDINGSEFSGYDYGSSTHFRGSTNGGGVQFYDYGASEYFNYKV